MRIIFIELAEQHGQEKQEPERQGSSENQKTNEEKPKEKVFTRSTAIQVAIKSIFMRNDLSDEEKHAYTQIIADLGDKMGGT
jgi:hypothetical protein